jgi:hypothetical protein
MEVREVHKWKCAWIRVSVNVGYPILHARFCLGHPIALNLSM